MVVEPKGRRGTQSVQRTLAVIRALANLGPEVRLMDLADHLKLPKSTVHRLLEELVRSEFVEQDPDSQRYCLGLGLLQISGRILEDHDIRKVAFPIMQALRSEVRESVYLNIVYEDERMVIDKLDSPESILHRVHIGQRGPLYAGAAGKVLLAYSSADVKKRVLQESSLQPLGPNTMTDPEVLSEELERVCSRGYAVSKQEVVEGVVAVACPVRNFRKEAVASLTVAAPAFRVNERRLAEFIEACRQGTVKVSARLGFPDRQTPIE